MSTKPVIVSSKPSVDAEDAPVNEALAAAKEAIAAQKRWAPSARQLGIGAAVGIGSAAIVAGLLYWRGAKK